MSVNFSTVVVLIGLDIARIHIENSVKFNTFSSWYIYLHVGYFSKYPNLWILECRQAIWCCYATALQVCFIAFTIR